MTDQPPRCKTCGYHITKDHDCRKTGTYSVRDISSCKHCYCMTHTIIGKGKVICGKCGGKKDDIIKS